MIDGYKGIEYYNKLTSEEKQRLFNLCRLLHDLTYDELYALTGDIEMNRETFINCLLKCIDTENDVMFADFWRSFPKFSEPLEEILQDVINGKTNVEDDLERIILFRNECDYIIGGTV